MNTRREEFLKHIQGVEEKVKKEGKELDLGNLFMAYKVENESQRRENESKGLDK